MNTPNTTHASSDASPAQLEREVDRQREHIGGLVDALENKLSPGELFERVLSYSKGGGSEFVGNLGNTIKANPVPALLTAAGLVWLYASKDQSAHGRHAYVTGGSAGSTGVHGPGTHTPGTRDAHGGSDHDHGGIGERLRDAREGMSDTMGHASESMGHLKDRAGDMTHEAMDSARERARQVNDGFQHMLEDNPLAVGAIGIAVGALLGAMLPTTRKEDELLGETSDRFTDKAKSMARQGYDQVAEAGRELGTSKGGDGKDISGRQDAGSGQNAGQTGTRQAGPAPTGMSQAGTGQAGTGHRGPGQTANQAGQGAGAGGSDPGRF